MFRHTRLLLALGMLLPVLAIALDYSDQGSRYTDAPFSVPEAAGISLLSNLGAVEGNPDGTFHPERTLNRAEFLKIAIAGHPRIRASNTDAKNCFPDVFEEDWFSRYVCLSKRRGVIGGYPDGYFRPGFPVNYAEALKILGELYDYTAWAPPDAPWYTIYVQAAQNHKTILPIHLAYDEPLTRGQMARLAAAYRAEATGELDLYRRAERGEIVVAPLAASSSSIASMSSLPFLPFPPSSSSSSFSADVTVFSSSSQRPPPDLPARSHFLVLGERTSPIASAAFFSAREPARIREANAIFEREITSLDAVFLVDAAGVQIGQLHLDPYDTTNKTWTVTFGTESAYELPQDQDRVLAIEAYIKLRNGGGSSEQLVEVDDFTLIVEGVFSGNSYASLSPPFPFPKHQTAQGRITRVANALGESDALPLGNDQLVGAFTFEGSVVSGAVLRLEQLEFQISKAADVAVSGWELGSADSSLRVSCSVSADIATCPNIPAELGALEDGPRTLRLFGDVALNQGAHDPFLQVSFNQPGGISENGAIRWTDGSGHFNWIELAAPVARGTRWQ